MLIAQIFWKFFKTLHSVWMETWPMSTHTAESQVLTWLLALKKWTVVGSIRNIKHICNLCRLKISV